MFCRYSRLLSAASLLCLHACSGGHSASHDEDDADAGADAGGEEAGASDDVDPRCKGRLGARRGKSSQSVMAGGASRTFVYYAPESLDAEKPTPLVISPHGYLMSGETMYTVTGFKELADRENIAVVFPDGESFSKPWNVGEKVSGSVASVAATGDDQSFLDAILDFVDEDVCLDREHVFVSGFSMGGYFSNEVGCLRSDIAGIGPHSGGSHDLSACPGSIKPVIIFHGDTDGLVPYMANGIVARDRWLMRNGCSAEFDSEPVLGGSCEYYKDCPEHAQVALCHFEGMAHNWAGGHDNTRIYGDPSRESAAELAWKFWKKYAW